MLSVARKKEKVTTELLEAAESNQKLRSSAWLDDLRNALQRLFTYEILVFA